MQHARRILPIMTACALFFTATPATFACDGHVGKVSGSNHVQKSVATDEPKMLGEVEGKRTFFLELDDSVQKAKGKWRIDVAKAKKGIFYTHTSKKVSSTSYVYIAPKQFKLAPGKYLVSGQFYGTVDGKEVITGVEYKVKVNKDHEMKIIKKVEPR
ncbi:hypothetical protein SAMN05444487_111145 [Marininema mesophilum]|uniref:YtkA-like n=1 Tax=Marininema mesophilum TaxID=1048340 RepID=A0A1H2ZQ71_9BACL|nr:hypothetical protein [Marininema mesophilum]SDX19048.1 hypothetical protein SAMN05444487_111145 [Marininema mesophilum]